ncbi:uncharacterized protein LOC100844379 [Brachypodium distachyon]|uniref:Uncharacterized protein n=1 Tax=Brachypodium distachyon TaxID=15368 RepID=I1HY73_BRADI|nr:uncharacterized protein LOC100844379 [Brachypodium distachyon]KQJ93782.1 hypothetical protein BRADI_3g06695v3 [Brachypodium distachyon]|eukprot:XP_010233956.1 uncharacterized protein LOC100844379 [Brachypodium distachyon]
MGGCFSSSSSGGGGAGGVYYYEESGATPAAAGTTYGRRVRPSDEDGLYYVGERDVDNKAGIYIAKFHRYQSEIVPQTPAASIPSSS